MLCRQWALQQIGGESPSQTANQNLTAGAVVGTGNRRWGSVRLIGSASGNAGAGASNRLPEPVSWRDPVASDQAADSEYQLQRRYNIAYQAVHVCEGEPGPGHGAAAGCKPLGRHRHHRAYWRGHG